MAHRLPTVSTLTRPEIWAEVVKHRGLCGLVARRYRGRGIDHRELVTEGMFGVYRAVELFDPLHHRNAAGGPIRFSTYATCWIHQAINHALGDIGSTIRIPREGRRTLASAEVLAPVRSLDAIPFTASRLAATEVPTGLDDDQVEQLTIAIATLNPRQREVLTAIFVAGERPTDLAIRLGLSKQCVFEHQRKGLDRLREMFEGGSCPAGSDD